MSFCGTPEYLAPEMVSHAGHDKNVDWWALGVLIYEMLIGVTPFYNRNRNMLLMKIKNSKVIFPDKTKYKIEYSDEIVDLNLNHYKIFSRRHTYARRFALISKLTITSVSNVIIQQF